jgi:hypothetical protein
VSSGKIAFNIGSDSYVERPDKQGDFGAFDPVVREEYGGFTAAIISYRLKVLDIAGFGGVDIGFLAN